MHDILALLVYVLKLLFKLPQPIRRLADDRDSRCLLLIGMMIVMHLKYPAR